MTSPLQSRPIRRLLCWQAGAVVVFAVLGGAWSGSSGAVSGALGAAIHLVANFVYALMGGIVRPASAAGALFVVIRAEAFKIALLLAQLVLVFRFYRDLASGPFIVAFVVTAFFFVFAIAAREST
ncbi:MAG TPA: ATP synthase subunit I [Casimicrobiaceae bacterium]|nr:ATP synthase subunit I [Casimicrobiaceae bacterium]